MAKPRYLTKTRFKLGLECPTKLFYTGKAAYPDKKKEDPFLAALADGGFQVGELAKNYFPHGHNIATLDYEAAEQQTQALLLQPEVVIFEPAIRWQNLFIRVDILVKEGARLNLIEVKAKSFDNQELEPFLNQRAGGLKAEWKPYLFDVAFQTYVLKKALPACSVNSVLMLVDKNSRCPTDGLNQKFRVARDATNRKGVQVTTDLSTADLAEKILRGVAVDKYVEMILNSSEFPNFAERSFADLVFNLARAYANDTKIVSPPGAKCAACEFKCSMEEAAQGVKSGFRECWAETFGWQEADFQQPNVLQLWNFRKKDEYIKSKIIKLTDLTEDDISPKTDNKPGLSLSERQWLQVEKAQANDKIPYVDLEGLALAMKKWQRPLHFIDFETAAVAIPFNKGMHPYEGVAFQFSHHLVTEDGTVEHKGQYLNALSGVFPSYDFVRELQKELGSDKGTIFRYSHHENTYLNIIYRQLQEDATPPGDRDLLCEFIKSITRNSADKWEGPRSMVDMCELVKRFYYAPETNGSNSIKYVLPAILNSSKYLQEKYSAPIYGAAGGIKSLNFQDWQWLKKEAGKVVDPYKLLPKLFQDISDNDYELLSEDDELRDGGAAQTAYCRLQFTAMSAYERAELEKGLLKYCELDTLAMVMIYEAWQNMITSRTAY